MNVHAIQTFTLQPPTKVRSIIIRPLARPGLYQVADRETGRELIANTRTPGCSAARVLLDHGAAPTDRLAMFREERDRPDLVGVIGWLAERTVLENERQGPTFAKYRPFARDAFAV